MNMDFVLQVERMPQLGETLMSRGMELFPGGKGGNQAYAAGRLGGRVTMLGAVGQDVYGDMLCQNLLDAGVDVSAVKRAVDSGTGTAFICVNGQGDNSILVSQGANELVTKELIDLNIALLETCDVVLFQLEIPLEAVCYGIHRAKEMGKIVILDPAPAQENLPPSLFRNVDFLKPNEVELRVLTGEADREQACEKLLQMGVKNLIVTLGAEGALWCTGDGNRRHFSGKNGVQAVDTTAAGDSFTAAAALGLARGWEIPRAIAFAVEVSGIVVTRKGAQASIPSAAELERLI